MMRPDCNPVGYNKNYYNYNRIRFENFDQSAKIFGGPIISVVNAWTSTVYVCKGSHSRMPEIELERDLIFVSSRMDHYKVCWLGI